MSFSHSHIAVQGLKPAQALELLGMEVAEVRRPAEMVATGIYMGELPGGWLLLLWDRGLGEAEVSQLAALGPAVFCDVHDIVMYCEARGYEGGTEVWRVVRDCERGPYALDVTGNPPAQLESIFREARAEQKAEGGEDAGVDLIYDVPPKLVESICGFRLGEEEPEGFLYSKLRKIGSAKAAPEGRGFFARLFGRG